MANKTNCVVNGKPRYRLQFNTGEYHLDKNGNLAPTYKNFYGVNKSDAEKKRDEWLEQHKHDGEPTFFHEMSYFLDSILSNDESLKESTRRLYKTSWKSNFDSQPFLFQKVSEVDAKTLQKEINNLKVGFSTKKQIIKVLRHFYAYEGVENHIQDRSTYLSVKRDKRKKQKNHVIEVWSDTELKKIMTAAAGHRLEFLIIIAINTGMRISEILGLQYSDFKDKTVSVVRQVTHTENDSNGDTLVLSTDVPKTADSVRTIPLNKAVLDAFVIHRKRFEEEMTNCNYTSEFLFTSRTGKLLERRNVYRSLSRLYKIAGVRYRKFHCFRSTFASKLAMAGVKPSTLAELLGHSDVSVTAKYYINVPDDEKQAAVDLLNSDNLAI